MAKPESPPGPLSTERLVLRCYEPSDAQALFEAIRANRDHLHRVMPWVDVHQTVTDTMRYIRQSRSDFQHLKDLTMGMFAREDGALLGATGIHRINWDLGRMEIGYWLRADVQGRGYATESTWRLTRFAFEDLGATCVELRIEVKNLKSQGVPDRLGFHFDGTLRHVVRVAEELQDHRVYSLVRAEFLAKMAEKTD